jgi:DNA repair protein RecO (recombination protein O)
MYLNTQGLVLRETNYKEADKLLTVLTRDYGKRTVKARACRRKSSKLMASAQLLVYSEMTLFERQERYTLHEASVKEQFLGLRQDVILLSLASYFAEVLDVVSQEGVSHPELLSLILNSMYALDHLQKPPMLVKAAFELSLLCHSGYEPLLDHCAACGEERPAEPRLHLREGVLHCAACRSHIEAGISMPVNAAALAAMRHIAWGDPKKLFSFRLDEESLLLLSDVTEAFLLTQLERGFHTLDFYKTMNRKEM